MGKIKSILLKDSERLALETGFRQGDSHCFRMRCRAVLLKSTGLSSKAIEQDRQSVSKAREAWQKATGKEASDLTFKRFFISLGARYKRIRKRPRGVPSPQLYAYKTEKLQELEHLNTNGKIDLYYADESHVCTEGYVPYGWQFRNEDVYIPSPKAQRVNITSRKTICDIFPKRFVAF